MLNYFLRAGPCSAMCSVACTFWNSERLRGLMHNESGLSRPIIKYKCCEKPAAPFTQPPSASKILDVKQAVMTLYEQESLPCLLEFIRGLNV